MTPTPSQTIGPFFGFALPFSDDAAAAPSGSPDTLRIEGQVLDGAGDPVPDALLEISENDQFARCRTDAEGAFHFIVRKPNEALNGTVSCEVIPSGELFLKAIRAPAPWRAI